MPPKTPFILPLYQLFEQLQQYEAKLKHRCLSPQNYLELVEVLVRGYAMVSREDLYSLCKLMWLKPHFSERKFRSLFDAHLAPYQIIEVQKELDADRNETGIDLSSKNSKGAAPSSPEPQKKESIEEEIEEEVLGEDAPSEEEENAPGTSESAAEFSMVAMRFERSAAAEVNNEPQDWEALEESIFTKNYRLKGQYFPVGKRKIQQTMRALRIPSELSDRWSIDWPATIDRISQQGYFDQVMYRRQTSFSNELCVLIDRGPSMVAFHQLADEVAQAVSKSSGGKATATSKQQVYYFNNFPINYVYLDRAQTDALPLAEFVTNLRRPLLIISDAGAARGRYNRDRIKQTQRFINKFYQHPIAWLNPLPRSRWRENSATFISRFVPMYAITPRELSNAIKSFKRKK